MGLIVQKDKNLSLQGSMAASNYVASGADAGSSQLELQAGIRELTGTGASLEHSKPTRSGILTPARPSPPKLCPSPPPVKEPNAQMPEILGNISFKLPHSLMVLLRIWSLF